MQSINPFTGDIIATYQPFDQATISQLIALSLQAFQDWSATSTTERMLLFEQLANIIEKNKENYARLITAEMGKPIRESRLELAKCVFLCHHIAAYGAEYLAEREVKTEARKSNVRFEPLGILLAIMPWNFPFWQVFRFSVPAIAAGNTVLLKHAPNVTGCALAISEAFVEAGFPPHVLNPLIMHVEHTELVIGHPAVRGVSITGSERAGRIVAAMAGKHLKKIALELGGSDPFIVFPDAEFGNACTTGMLSRLMNAGQVCIAAKRFLIHEEVYDNFLQQQIELFASLKPGNPLDEQTTIGPMARPDLMFNLQQQIERSVQMGAKITYGGKPFEQFPTIFMPTIVEHIRPGIPLWDEESFGPVMCLTPFRTPEEVIALANNSRYGLGASVWTSNPELAAYVAGRLQAGNVFVNSLVKSDPRLPFGGVKNSGFGRELGEEGIKEFVNVKTYWFE